MLVIAGYYVILGQCGVWHVVLQYVILILILIVPSNVIYTFHGPLLLIVMLLATVGDTAGNIVILYSIVYSVRRPLGREPPNLPN